MDNGRCRPIDAEQSVEAQDLELRGQRVLKPQQHAQKGEAATRSDEAEGEIVLRGRIIIRGLNGAAPSPTPGRPGPLAAGLAIAVGSTVAAIVVGKLKGEPWANELIERATTIAFSLHEWVRGLMAAFLA